LALARLASKLLHNLHDLRDAGSAHGVPFALEPAARVYGDSPAYRSLALFGHFTTLTLLAEPQVFDCHDFGYREAVVNFREIDVIRLDARQLVGS
jgi:hypothetical protein